MKLLEREKMIRVVMLLAAVIISLTSLTCRADPCDIIDAWITVPCETCYLFENGPHSPPIPAGFFDPCSIIFTGPVCFEGKPLGATSFGQYGDADTLVIRSSDPFDRCDLPSPEERIVAVELVALSLTSCEPITVTFDGGNPQLWDVYVDLSMGILSMRRSLDP